MIDTKHIRISDYNYPLPDERIAKFPIAQRDHSKLLIYQHGKVQEDIFYNLPSYLPEGALMVFNNTKVIQARMHFRKATGALIEVFLLEPYVPADYEQMFQTTARCEWICLVGNLKKWKEGALVRTVVLHGQEVHDGHLLVGRVDEPREGSVIVAQVMVDAHGCGELSPIHGDGHVALVHEVGEELVAGVYVTAPAAAAPFSPPGPEAAARYNCAAPFSDTESGCSPAPAPRSRCPQNISPARRDGYAG